MRTLRVSLWSALGVILLTAVAWSFSVLCFQIVSLSATRTEIRLKANLTPINIGYRGEAVSMSRPGIPLDANRAQKIGGRDLGEWLLHSQETKGEIQGLSELSAVVGNDAGARFRVVRLSSELTGTAFPGPSQIPGHVILLIAIPPDGASGCSAPCEAELGQLFSGNIRPEAIPASGVSRTVK